MASTICASSILCSSSAHRRSSSKIFAFSDSAILCSKTSKFCLSKSIHELGISSFRPWNGLRHMGMSIRWNYVKKEGKGRCRGKVVYASLFGVGAPEALVIGVVALLVFGPKGLAEVARNLGKTLRAFQPTIRELQEVSKEFKNTLEREIGLDEVTPSKQYTNSSTSATLSQSTPDLNGSPSTSNPYTSEEYLKVTEEQLSYATQSKEGQLQEETSQQDAEGAPQADAPKNIGQFLVQAQLRSSTSQQEETLLQEGQSDIQLESQSQPQANAPATGPETSSPEKIESEA